jgi:hypothetical protein
MIGSVLVFEPNNSAAAPPPIDAESDELDLGLVQGFNEEWSSNRRQMGSKWKTLRDARTEYYDDRIDLSLLSSDVDFKKSFNSKPDGEEGTYIMQYFNFLRFIIFSNFVMTMWCFIGWIPHVQNARPLMDKEGLGEMTDSTSAVDLLFLSSYQPSSDKYWIAMMVLGTTWMMCTGSLYMLVCRVYFSEEQDSAVNDQTNHRNEISDIIHPDLPNPSSHRIVATYLVLTLICLIPIGINYGLLYEVNRKNLKVSHFTSCECPRFSALPPALAPLLPAADLSSPALVPAFTFLSALVRECGGPVRSERKEKRAHVQECRDLGGNGVGRDHRQVRPRTVLVCATAAKYLNLATRIF